MRMTLFSAIAVGGVLLASQVPALAQGAFAYPPNGLDDAAPATTPAPQTQGRIGGHARYYDYEGQYSRAQGSNAAPSDVYVPGNIQIGR